MIGFKDFCVAGITVLSIDGLSRQKTLKIRELDAAVKSEKVHFDFQNLVRHLAQFTFSGPWKNVCRLWQYLQL